MNTQTIRKAAGYGGLGLVLATAVVVAFGKNIAAWPGRTTAKITRNAGDISGMRKDVDHQKEIVTRIENDVKQDIKDAKEDREALRTEQRALRKDINKDFDDLKDLIRDGR